MIKVVSLFRRKPGLTHEEFRDYYENEHVKLFKKYFEQPGVERYVRRYLTPIEDSIAGEYRNAGFDVITEVWLSDPAIYESLYKSENIDPEFQAFIAADEEKFLDRQHMYAHVVEEFEADYVRSREGLGDEFVAS